MEFQPEYGLIAAGAVNSTFIGRLPGLARVLGPVAGVSYRVASRMANTLRAGAPVRTAGELGAARSVLFHAPPEQFEAIIGLLKSARLDWSGKSLLFCDSEAGGDAEYFRAAGASVAEIRSCPLPGRMAVRGANPALATAHRIVGGLRMQAIEIDGGNAAAFDAAILLGTGALTPLIDRAAGLLRACGIRDGDAMRLAAALFERTSKEYAHSGRQSWVWYARAPDVERLLRHVNAFEGGVAEVAGDLILSGFEAFGRHPEAARRIRAALKP